MLSDNQRRVLPLALIMLIGAVLRIFGLGNESLWLDEATTVARIHGTWLSLLSNGTQGPFYLILIKAWTLLFGESEFALRLPSALFGIASIPALFLLGQVLFNRTTAMWAALFLAINPFAIFYSQDARPYALYFFGAILSYYYLIRVLREFRARDAVAYILYTLIAAYSHPYGPLLILSHWISAGIYVSLSSTRYSRQVMMRVIGMLSLAALLFVPQLYVFAATFIHKSQSHTIAAWIPTPDIESLHTTLRQYFMFPILGYLVVLIIVAVVVMKIRRDMNARVSLILCGVIILSNLLLPWIVSILVTPIYVDRYTIPTLAAVIIMLGWALNSLQRPLRILAMSILMLLSIPPLFTYFSGTDKDPWRETCGILNSQLRSGDVILAYPEFDLDPLHYYLRPPPDVRVFSPQDHQDIVSALRSSRAIWLVRAYSGDEKLEHDIYFSLSESRRSHETIKIRDSLKCNRWAYHVADIQITRFESEDQSARGKSD